MHPWVIKFKKSKEMIITKVRSVIISGRRERERAGSGKEYPGRFQGAGNVAMFYSLN